PRRFLHPSTPPPLRSTLFPYTTLFRSAVQALIAQGRDAGDETWLVARSVAQARLADRIAGLTGWVDEQSFDCDEHDGRFVNLREDRKSTRLNSSHVAISYAVFCLKKKT